MSNNQADKGVSIDSKEISVKKYKEMPLGIVNDTLQILGYCGTEDM